MTGAIITPTGTLAAASSRTMRSRVAGDAVRGSSFVLRSLLKVVMLTATLVRPLAASSASRSKSRRISAPLVTMVTGWRYSSSTSSTARVTRWRFSPGW